MNAQASTFNVRLPRLARWGLWLTASVIGQGIGYFIFILGKLGRLDEIALFSSAGAFMAVMLAPAILIPALAWHVLQMGSRKVPVSLLQGMAAGFLGVLAGMVAQVILVSFSHMFLGLT